MGGAGEEKRWQGGWAQGSRARISHTAYIAFVPFVNQNKLRHFPPTSNKYYFLSVYAVALYVDEQDAAALQARTGEEWLQRLLTGGARCQLRIKFYRGVGRDEMIKAIEDSVIGVQWFREASDVRTITLFLLFRSDRGCQSKPRMSCGG